MIFKMLYVPAGAAHGFQALQNDTEVLDKISEFNSPAHACGVRWNDPAFGIRWPDDERTPDIRQAIATKL